MYIAPIKQTIMKAVFLTLFVLCILYAIGLLETDITNVGQSLLIGGIGILFLFAGINVNNIINNKNL